MTSSWDEEFVEEAAQEITPANRYNFRPGDVVIAVMGVTGVGKTSFISLLTEEDVVIGHTLEACTSRVGIHECAQITSGRRLFLIDTPGFDDTYKSDTDILREVANWLSTAYENNVQLTGIIYLHRILDIRLGGSAMKNLRMFKKLCGDNGLGSVVLATTMWDDVDHDLGLKREQDLLNNPLFWAGMVAKGSKVFRHDKKITSAMEIVSYLIKQERPIVTDLAKEMVDNGKTLDDTSAGRELTAELAEQKKRFEETLKNIRKEMEEAMEKSDRKWHAELEGEKRETLRKLRQEEAERVKMRSDWEKLKKEKDEELAKEREKAAAKGLESMERMLNHEHELALMRANHENSAALQAKQFELEKARAENLRLRQQEEDRCVIM